MAMWEAESRTALRWALATWNRCRIRSDLLELFDHQTGGDLCRFPRDADLFLEYFVFRHQVLYRAVFTILAVLAAFWPPIGGLSPHPGLNGCVDGRYHVRYPLMVVIILLPAIWTVIASAFPAACRGEGSIPMRQRSVTAWTVQTKQGSKERTTCSTSTGSSGSCTVVPIMAASQGPGMPCLSLGEPFHAVGVITW